MKLATDKINHTLEWGCLFLAGWFILSFTFVALMSMTYPFHLEWMEGQSIDVIQRIRDGLPIYTKPSIEYVPFIYTPYYFYVCAFVSLFTGVDFFPARLVSTLAALGCGAIIYSWVRRDGGNWRVGVISAGLFFSTYQLSARWFDVGRIDSLFLLLMLGGLYVFYHYRGLQNATLAGLLLTAAFFTKQSTLLAVLPALIVGLFIDRKHTLQTIAVFGLLTGSGVLLADMLTQGWFNFYIFDVPAAHAIDKRFILGFWLGDMFRPLGVLIGVSVITFIAGFYRDIPKGLWYAALAAGLVGTSYASRLHGYGWSNVLIPAHATLALMMGLSLIAISRSAFSRATPIILALIGLQLTMLLYNPVKLIPTEESQIQGEKFLAEIGAIEGDIFIPELQFVQTRVGKKSYGLGMAAFDIFRANLKEKNAIKHELGREIADALRNQRFTAIMPGRLIRLPESQGYYQFERRLSYPREYVTGAINFLRTDLFVRIQNNDNQESQP